MISVRMIRIIIFISLCCVLIVSCKYQQSEGNFISVAGFTQGTTYHITYQSGDSVDLSVQFDSLLHVFDHSLSTYLPSSIITAINENQEDVETDTLFRTVFREAERVNKLSGGAFDITIGPIIDAWGFGSGAKLEIDSAVIDSLLQFVGMNKVWLDNGQIIKSNPGVRLDVNAIAQGYAVDFVSAFLDEKGVKNYLVEIGGELRTKGLNPKRTLWGIGVDRPDDGNMLPGDHLQTIIRLSGRSLATSGNYRKYYEIDGVKYHHSIDPATGYSKSSRLLSTTIIAESCISADAYATSCMVMGLEKAKEFISGLKGVDAYLIYSDSSGVFQVWHTPGLGKYLEQPSR